MNFYVLAKCIDSEKGDVIIDLTESSIKIYRALYQLKEDREYQIIEDVVNDTAYFQWDIIKSYELAFGKGRNLNKNGFRFLSVNEKDSIRIDDNGLFYVNDLFLGKMMNEKEVEFLQKEGVYKFKLKLESSQKEGIKLLVRGKKIYRIFTKGKLKSLQNTLKYDQTLLELIEDQFVEDSAKKLEKVEADLKKAMELILGSMNTLAEIKKDKNHK